MREIRPYGSARGVRRNPYPYRDTLLPVRSTVRFSFFPLITPHPAASGPTRPSGSAIPPALAPLSGPPSRRFQPIGS